jgi:hypothetical protein
VSSFSFADIRSSAAISVRANERSFAAGPACEGHAELIGDIVLTCTGGIPTPAGGAVPAVNFTILLNTNVTSRLTNGLFTEALLLIDEPNPPLRSPSHPVLNCGNTGAPDNSGRVFDDQQRQPGQHLRWSSEWIWRERM